MKVVVYVEGPSDKLGLERIFRPLLDRKESQGVLIRFFVAQKGDRKDWLLTHGLDRARSILLNEPASHVVIMPDLQPPNRVFPHRMREELAEGLRREFAERVHHDSRMTSRFHAFCFHHQFEVLLLAQEDALRSHLGAAGLKTGWRKPPEEQNHEDPPKRVLERLFREHGRQYNEIAAVSLLPEGGYAQLREMCPISLGGLTELLEGVAPSTALL